MLSASYAITDLGTLPAPDDVTSYGLGINASGEVVGGSASTGPTVTPSQGGTQVAVPPTTSEAFLYSGGTLTDLGNLTGTYSSAYGINTTGTIVGVAQTSVGQPAAFVAADGAAVTVDVEDQFGNILTDDSSTLVTLGTKVSPAGVLFSPIAIDDVDGVATFTGMSFSVAGRYRFKATDTGLSPGKSDKFFVA